MATPVEDIKARLDIVELIQGYVRLQKAGMNFKAPCPFHGEKTPSFFVSPTRQMWHCFGCGRGGDHFKFVMEIEGHDFPEALRMLALRAGVELKREDPRIRSERNRLYDICDAAADIFSAALSNTPAVKTYLKERGMTGETARDFRIGFAPKSWDYLLKALAAKGFKAPEIAAAGLAIQSDDRSSWYDRFRSRIIFPISDSAGRTIGFGGRIFQPDPGKEEAKYINSPQTLIYDKSRVLYGFDKAKQEVRAKNAAVVVEGYMDCVMSHQAGVKNTIAVSGTALTPHQLTLLKRLCTTLISSFDTDAAGDSATRRSLALASEFEFERRIAVIPSGKDPADAVKENPEGWQNAVDSARPVVEFYFEKAFREGNPKTAEGKKAISALLLPFISELGNEIEKSHWVRRLSENLGVQEESIWKEMRKKGGTQAAGGRIKKEELPAPPPRRELLEERFLGLFSVANENARREAAGGEYLSFTVSANNDLFKVLSGPAAAVTPELQKQLDEVQFKGEVIATSVPDANKELLLLKRELERDHIRERLESLGKEIEKKEKEGDTGKVETLLKDFNALSGALQKR